MTPDHVNTVIVGGGLVGFLFAGDLAGQLHAGLFQLLDLVAQGFALAT